MVVRTMHAFVLLCAFHIAANSAVPAVLDRQTVARLAARQGPSVQVAQARRAEVEAQRLHADYPASGNPELALTVGPGFVNRDNTPALEFLALLTWPFDISGSGGARQRWADSQARAADADISDADRVAVGEALDLFARACAAEGRSRVAEARATLDAELVRIASVRRAAGDAGDGDLALARVMQAEGAALVQSARGEQQALVMELMALLGLAADTVPDLQDAAWPAPAPLDAMLENLHARPDLRRAAAQQQSAALDSDVQRKVGWTVPRITVGGGRGPEYQGELGLTVPLPVYQRNQVNAAVARARIGTAAVEAALATRAAAQALRAAHARFFGARAAYTLLQDSQPAVDDAEHLALRAFELGQDNLARTVVARREAVGARIALQEAKSAMVRARIALCVAAGTCHAEVLP